MKKLLAKALKLLTKKKSTSAVNRIGTGWTLGQILMLKQDSDNNPVIGWVLHSQNHRHCITLLKYQDRYLLMCIARLN